MKGLDVLEREGQKLISYAEEYWLYILIGTVIVVGYLVVRIATR